MATDITTKNNNSSLRTGVFICECGPNLKEAMDIECLVNTAAGLDTVAAAKSFNLLCSENGQEFIAREIIDNRLDRIVIGACSPNEHEKTFKNALKKAGLNYGFLQIVNLREQVAWVTGDYQLATLKAEALINAAVARVKTHKPLEEKYVECNTDVLVVGGGMAGISAALSLSQENRKVYLIEKSPVLGGHAAAYEDWFPGTTCAACEISPVLNEVINNDNITLYTMSEVTSVLGAYGNFTVTIKKNARYINEDKCLGCGACVESCPVTVPDEFNMKLNDRKAVYIPHIGSLPSIYAIDGKHCGHIKNGSCTACRDICPFDAVEYEQADELIELNAGAVILATGFDLFDPSEAPEYAYKKIPDIYTSMEFERLIEQNGPTAGRLVTASAKKPENITFIHCAGSRSRKYKNYCSGICCSYMLKYILYIHEKYPEIKTKQIFSDFCLPGKQLNSMLFRAEESKNHEFHRISAPGNVDINKVGDSIKVNYKDDKGEEHSFITDMAVLAPAMIGAQSSEQAATLFEVGRNNDGFYDQPFITGSPVKTKREGIYTAGCGQEPMNIPGAVTSGQAAASCILKELVPGRMLLLEPAAVQIDEDLCSGCRTCMNVCEFGAISYNKELHVSAVNPLLCTACGICAAACPGGAAMAPYYSDRAIYSELKGLLEKKNLKQVQEK